MKAVWNDTVLAESEDVIEIEGNTYFPPESIRREFLRPSRTETFCPWKGTAKYLSVVAGDSELVDAAWFYPQPKAEADRLRDFVAFWRGVKTIS